MKTKILILSIAAALPAPWTSAQDAGGPARPPGPPKDGARQPGSRDGDRPKGDGSRDGQRPPPGPMPMPPMPLLRALDKDDDGIISADEIKNASESLKTLDKNKDGQLTRDEYLPEPPPPPQGDGQRKPGARGASRDSDAKTTEKKANDWPFGKDKTAATTVGTTTGGAEKPAAPTKGERPPPPPSPLVEALDLDHDGVISADEIAKAPESLLKLDKNGDGQLGPREYGPRPPEGQPPRDDGKDAPKAGGKPAS